MTQSVVDGLRKHIPGVMVSVVNQGVETPVFADVSTTHHENVGFAFGMNLAIERGVTDTGAPDYVLCINNDIQFTDPRWWDELARVARGDRIVVPATDRAAIYVQAGALPKPSFPRAEASAYCWLVPFEWCKVLKATYGFWLFPEIYPGGYAEDNHTAYLLTKLYGPNPVFRMVPKSFVKHLKAQTAKIVKPDRAKNTATLRAFFESELEEPKLRRDLKRWCKNMLRVLR